MVNAFLVMPLPSNGALIGSNGLQDWLCNCPAYLLIDYIEWPSLSSSEVTDPLVRQDDFVLI